MSKFLPDDSRQFAAFLRERAEGHAPGYDIAVYARPHQWLAIAQLLERNQDNGALREANQNRADLAKQLAAASPLPGCEQARRGGCG